MLKQVFFYVGVLEDDGSYSRSPTFIYEADAVQWVMEEGLRRGYKDGLRAGSTYKIGDATLTIGSYEEVVA